MQGDLPGYDRAGIYRDVTVVASSLMIVQPGQTKVVRFFGTYVGTIRRPGLWWTVPLADRPKSSSITSTSTNPRWRASSTKSYWRRLLSRLVSTWDWDDWRT